LTSIDAVTLQEVSSKRHHFLPQFLLRRFAIAEGENTGLVWRADLDGQRLLRVAPKYEAARRHYYRLPPDSGLPPSFAEDLIGQIESLAAAAIARFERGELLDRAERLAIAFFLALQHRRTPRGRRELRHVDQVLSNQWAQLRASDGEAVKAAMVADGVPADELDVERAQSRLLDDLRSGRLILESSPAREIAMMFMGLEVIADRLVSEFDWMFLRVVDGAGDFVLPDVGVTLFDPDPPFPESGTGFASSATSETVLHLSPRLVLLLHPGPGYGDAREATPEDVERTNLRAVASSEVCIYGSSKAVVQATLEQANQDPERVNRLRPRPARLWITESEGEPAAGLADFVGYSVTDTIFRQFVVSEEAVRTSTRHGTSASQK
jgi:Protein of unknown function (DUF4238)